MILLWESLLSYSCHSKQQKFDFASLLIKLTNFSLQNSLSGSRCSIKLIIILTNFLPAEQLKTFRFFKANGQYVNPVGNSSRAAEVQDVFECLMDEALPKSFPWHVAIYSTKTRSLLSKRKFHSSRASLTKKKFIDRQSRNKMICYLPASFVVR